MQCGGEQALWSHVGKLRCFGVDQVIVMTGRKQPMIGAPGIAEPIPIEQAGAALDAAEFAITSWLLCRASSHHLALPMQHVVETMRTLPIQTVRSTPAIVRGLCVIRGEPTPVIDAAMLFDDRACHGERLVTVRTGKRTVALAIDAVIGVRAIATRDLRQMPPIMGDVQSIAAAKILDDELVFFLNAARVVPEDVFDRCMTEGAAP